ncbi:hypothetical protein DINM_022429 [Dirofilaria immitis]|nr:hypothetical protein [Dirofilaria immitis]
MDFDPDNPKWLCCCWQLPNGLMILASSEITISLMLSMYSATYIAMSNSEQLWFMITLTLISIMYGIASALLFIGIRKLKENLMYPTLAARAILIIFLQLFGNEPTIAQRLILLIFFMLLISIFVFYTLYLIVRCIHYVKAYKRLMRRKHSLIVACRIAMLVHGVNYITHESLAKYQVPDLPDSKIGYDGRLEWNPTESMDSTIHQFRTAVLTANIRVIKRILKDLQNLTPGQIERLLALLIDRSSAEPAKEALMTAICIGSRPLVEFILSLLWNSLVKNTMVRCQKSKSFPSHMTPLMLACICNNFAIVQCLLLRKHYIQLPHRPDCHCDECSRRAHCMANSIILLDTYRAISSEPFLWLACTDPLLAAFNLASDLEVCMMIEKEYKVAYDDLRNNVMTFAVKIAEQCWTTEEIHVLLSHKVGSTLADCELPFHVFN